MKKNVMRTVCLMLILIILCVGYTHADTNGRAYPDAGWESAMENVSETQAQAPILAANRSGDEADGWRIFKEINYDSDGKVKSEIEHEYDAYGNEIKVTAYIDGKKYNWKETDYDEKGNVIQEGLFYSRGYAYKSSKYEYDLNGNRIRYMIFDQENAIITWEEYEYDARGNLIKALLLDDDGSVSKWQEFAYDTNGNKILWREILNRTNDSPWIEFWYEYEYDAAGHMIKETTFDRYGWPRSIVGYAYNAKGDKARETHYKIVGGVDYYYDYIYEHDAYGNLIRLTVVDNLGWISTREEYRYDTDGNLIKWQKYSYSGAVDRIVTWEEYEYDAYGNRTKWTEYKPTGVIQAQHEYIWQYYSFSSPVIPGPEPAKVDGSSFWSTFDRSDVFRCFSMTYDEIAALAGQLEGVEIDYEIGFLYTYCFANAQGFYYSFDADFSDVAMETDETGYIPAYLANRYIEGTDLCNGVCVDHLSRLGFNGTVKARDIGAEFYQYMGYEDLWMAVGEYKGFRFLFICDDSSGTISSKTPCWISKASE